MSHHAPVLATLLRLVFVPLNWLFFVNVTTQTDTRVRLDFFILHLCC